MKRIPNRIIVNQQILNGKPIIRGLRISAEHILNALTAGIPQEEILQDYPDLEPEDIQAILHFSTQL